MPASTTQSGRPSLETLPEYTPKSCLKKSSTSNNSGEKQAASCSTGPNESKYNDSNVSGRSVSRRFVSDFGHSHIPKDVVRHEGVYEIVSPPGYHCLKRTVVPSLNNKYWIDFCAPPAGGNAPIGFGAKFGRSLHDFFFSSHFEMFLIRLVPGTATDAGKKHHADLYVVYKFWKQCKVTNVWYRSTAFHDITAKSDHPISQLLQDLLAAKEETERAITDSKDHCMRLAAADFGADELKQKARHSNATAHDKERYQQHTQRSDMLDTMAGNQVASLEQTCADLAEAGHALHIGLNELAATIHQKGNPLSQKKIARGLEKLVEDWWTCEGAKIGSSATPTEMAEFWKHYLQPMIRTGATPMKLKLYALHRHGQEGVSKWEYLRMMLPNEQTRFAIGEERPMSEREMMTLVSCASMAAAASSFMYMI